MSTEYSRQMNSKSSVNYIMKSLEQLKLLEKCFDHVVCGLEERSKDQITQVSSLKSEVYSLLAEDFICSHQIEEKVEGLSIQSAFNQILKKPSKPLQPQIKQKKEISNKNIGYSQKAKALRKPAEHTSNIERGFKIFTKKPAASTKPVPKLPIKEEKRKKSLSASSQEEIQGMSGASHSHRNKEVTIKKKAPPVVSNSSIIRGSFQYATISSKGKEKGKSMDKPSETKTPKRREISSSQESSYKQLHKRVLSSNNSSSKKPEEFHVAKPEPVTGEFSTGNVKSASKGKAKYKKIPVASGSIMKESDFVQKFSEKSLHSKNKTEKISKNEVPNTIKPHNSHQEDEHTREFEQIEREINFKEEIRKSIENIYEKVATPPKPFTQPSYPVSQSPFVSDNEDFKGIARTSIYDIYKKFEVQGVPVVEEKVEDEQEAVSDYIGDIYRRSMMYQEPVKETKKLKVNVIEREEEVEKDKGEEKDEEYFREIARNSIANVYSAFNFSGSNENYNTKVPDNEEPKEQINLEETHNFKQSSHESQHLLYSESEQPTQNFRFSVKDYLEEISSGFQTTGIPYNPVPEQFPQLEEVQKEETEELEENEEYGENFIRDSICNIYQKVLYNHIEEEKRVSNAIAHQRSSFISPKSSVASGASDFELFNEYNETFIWKFVEEIYQKVAGENPAEEQRNESSIDYSRTDNYNLAQESVLEDSNINLPEEEEDNISQSEISNYLEGAFHRASMVATKRKSELVSTATKLSEVEKETLSRGKEETEGILESSFRDQDLIHSFICQIYENVSENFVFDDYSFQKEEEEIIDTEPIYSFIEALYSNVAQNMQNEHQNAQKENISELVRFSIDNLYGSLEKSGVEVKDSSESEDMEEIEELAVESVEDIIRRASESFAEPGNFEFTIKEFISNVYEKILSFN